MTNNQPLGELKRYHSMDCASRSSGAISLLTTLSDKIYQGEYSPRNIPLVAEPSIDSRTTLKIMISMALFLIGSQLKQSEHQFFAVMKLLWLISLLSYFYLFPAKTVKKFRKQLILFFVLRQLSSTVAYSLFTGDQMSYGFHAESQEHDILLNLFFTLLAALYIQRELSIIKNCLLYQFASNTILLGILQFWFQTFDWIVFIRLAALFLAFVVFGQLLFARSNLDRQLMQATVSKHCEDISQELNEIRNKLEQESQATLSSMLNTSQVDELVMKIKYLKFSLLQKENEKSFLNTRKVFTNARRRTYMGQCLGPASPYGERRNEENLCSAGSISGLKKQSSCMVPTNLKNDIDSKWKIEAEDCDSLVKLILEKQVIMWYPEVLKAKDNQVCKETAEFLKQHFTEVGNSLLNNNFSSESKQPPSLVPKTFDCSPWSNYLETNICSWNFDMLKFKELTNGNHMLEFGSAIMRKFDTLKVLHTNSSTVTSFLRDVSDSYLPNPYHNSIHGADVCNALGYFLAQKEFGGYFSELEISCLLISGLVHDLGHPGLNNAFLVATKSTEALLYNDQSVLENFHTTSFFKILQKSSSNILENLSEKDYKYFRKLAINVILDTGFLNLTKHFIIVTKFKNNADSINLKEENDRFLSLSIALKCADVSHGAKELNLHKRWSRRITEEFFYQGDKERRYKIPVTPLCDRKGNISKSQHGFLNFIVLPLFEAFDQKFFSEEMKKTVTNQIKTNIQYWTEEIPKEEQGEKNFMKDTERILEDIANEAAIDK